MEALRKAMKKAQDSERYEHTLSVAYTAACLASLYDVDVEKALKAGLLHDCAKCLSVKKKFSLCEKYHVEITDMEKRNPSLLHAKLGARLAKEKYGEVDQDILNAVCYHTTGRAGMSMLEKIIFVADYMEPGRNKAPDLPEVRRLAFTDIDKAIVKILQDMLKYLEKRGGEIDPATKNTLEYYLQKQ